jgi:hypothetical protein
MAAREATPAHVQPIPPGAWSEWLRLTAELDAAGPVPCQTVQAEAWWPDRKQFGSPATALALEGCYRCPVADACLAFALAAGERQGIWGGTLPDQRRLMRRRAA